MECYKEFAHIYDELINSDINYKEWASQILKICDELKVNRKDYLDLACGTGNITGELVSEFNSTWAVDLSYDMLTEAETKLRGNRNNIKFVCQDITELNLNRRFDLITCCLDSTNYILEDSKLKEYFSGVLNHLKDEGIFIFDINSYYKLTEVLGNNVYNYDDENVTYIWQNSLEDDIVDMYLTFFAKQGELYKRFDEQHSERAYKCEEIETILNEIGLKIVVKMNNYEDKDIEDSAERIVYVVKKGD